MPRFDVTTIGEGQLRYSVPLGRYLEQANQLDVNITGTEANVTSLLARLGWNCGWITGLPNNPLGRRVASGYSQSGLDMSASIWSDEGRLAIYYIEFAGPPRNSQVHYDRKNTVFTGLTINQIDWDYLLDTRLLHISGLTVPLSDSIHEIVLEAIGRAKEAGIPISFDMNYRSRVWSAEVAAKTIQPIIKQVDILFFARGDAQRMYGFEGEPKSIVKQIAELTDAKYIITSLSRDGIIAWDREQYYFEPTRKITVLDRIGAGDAMVAGVLHGWLQNDLPKGLRYGALTAALCLSNYGDAVITTRDNLEELLISDNHDIVR
jgi:2-dehydro-3-deoxygluconokinase